MTFQTSRIAADALKRPELFLWNGPIDQETLTGWLQSRSLTVPVDLCALWQSTGGGDFLESETILGPFGDPTLGDDLEGANAWYREKGLPPGYLVVHKGLELTAVRLSDGKYVVLDERSFSEKAVFNGLDEWYEETIRAEFAEHYGLS